MPYCLEGTPRICLNEAMRRTRSMSFTDSCACFLLYTWCILCLYFYLSYLSVLVPSLPALGVGENQLSCLEKAQTRVTCRLSRVQQVSQLCEVSPLLRQSLLMQLSLSHLCFCKYPITYIPVTSVKLTGSLNWTVVVAMLLSVMTLYLG